MINDCARTLLPDPITSDKTLNGSLVLAPSPATDAQRQFVRRQPATGSGQAACGDQTMSTKTEGPGRDHIPDLSL
jgi:hypothetical protein